MDCYELCLVMELVFYHFHLKFKRNTGEKLVMSSLSFKTGLRVIMKNYEAIAAFFLRIDTFIMSDLVSKALASSFQLAVDKQ